MNFLRRTKLPIMAATVLLTASLALASTQTEEHEKPVHHKAPKAEHHSAPKAEHHSAPKAAKHESVRVAHPETPKPARHASKKSRKKRPRGQQAIDTERARQIQEALVREHYMSGQPSGTWDSATQTAMRRYQADQGWQNKTVPDSRALIRLGLGPDHGHLLNPESAMTTEPQLPHGTQAARQTVSSASANSSSAGRANSTPAIQQAQPPTSIAVPAAAISPSR